MGCRTPRQCLKDAEIADLGGDPDRARRLLALPVAGQVALVGSAGGRNGLGDEAVAPPARYSCSAISAACSLSARPTVITTSRLQPRRSRAPSSPAKLVRIYCPGRKRATAADRKSVV